MHMCVQFIYIAISRKKGNVHECPINLYSLFDVSRERSCNVQLKILVVLLLVLFVLLQSLLPAAAAAVAAAAVILVVVVSMYVRNQ